MTVERAREAIAEGLYRENLLREGAVDAVLTALRAAGLVIVPRAPSAKMIRAGETAANKAFHAGTAMEMKAAWAAMLAACQENADAGDQTP
jgi:hypothetical protein